MTNPFICGESGYGVIGNVSAFQAEVGGSFPPTRSLLIKEIIGARSSFASTEREIDRCPSDNGSWEYAEKEARPLGLTEW